MWAPQLSSVRLFRTKIPANGTYMGPKKGVVGGLGLPIGLISNPCSSPGRLFEELHILVMVAAP